MLNNIGRFSQKDGQQHGRGSTLTTLISLSQFMCGLTISPHAHLYLTSLLLEARNLDLIATCTMGRKENYY